MPSSTKRRAIPPKRSKRKWFLALGIVIIILISIVAYIAAAQIGQPATKTFPPTKVLLQTTSGNITIDLRTDKPITSGNFVNLVKEGKYDNTTFYRTMVGFMIQGGQVNSYVAPIRDEIGSNNHNYNYTVAMAKTSDPNSATSEFFINVADNSKIVYSDGTKFDAVYTVFGTVISGQDIVEKIANAPATTNPNNLNNPQEISNPVSPVTIIKASILS